MFGEVSWEEKVNVKDFTIKEFLDIKDRELQRFIYQRRGNLVEIVKAHVNNDEKEGYYRIQNSLKPTKKGAFYKHSSLLEWIVYNKGTKKVSVSKGRDRVFRDMLEDQFRHPDIVEQFMGHSKSPTICKLIITKKVNTVRDLIRYRKSYVLRNKDIGDEVLYKLVIHEVEDKARIITNINIDSDENIRRMSNSKLSPSVWLNNTKKYDVWDDDVMIKDHERWVKEQSEKYASFERSLNVETCGTTAKDTPTQVSDIGDEVLRNTQV